jgi:hypothetical protein
MSEETKTRPASEIPSGLPEIFQEGSTLYWELPLMDKKYKLREAKIGEIAEAAAGARSEDEKNIRKFSLVVQEQDANGKWVPLQWPDGGADLLYENLKLNYMMGLTALAVRTKNSLKISSAKTGPTTK